MPGHTWVQKASFWNFSFDIAIACVWGFHDHLLVPSCSVDLRALFYQKVMVGFFLFVRQTGCGLAFK